MITLGIDPGEAPAYSLAARNGDVLAVTLRLLDLPPVWVDRIVVEGQWIAKGPPSRRKAKSINIVTLGFAAGWQIRTASLLWPEATLIRAPVKDWKGARYRSGERLAKEIFCNRVYSEQPPQVQQWIDSFPKSRRPDALDAIGLAQFGASLTNPDKYKVPHYD